MKRRTFVFILAVLIILSAMPSYAFAAVEGRYNASDVSASAGEEFSLEVSLPSNPGIISLRFFVEYDSTVVELVRVEEHGLLKGYTTPAPNISSPYTIRWADSLATSNNKAQGKLVTLTFKALKAADTMVQIKHEEARDYKGNKVTFQDDSAKILIKGAIVAPSYKVSILGSNLTFGNSLDMNFFLKASDLSGTGYTAKITHKSAATQIPQSSWKKMGSYYCITCTGISPDEMVDEIQVKILNAKGEQVSADYADSVQNYARRIMNRTGHDSMYMHLFVALLEYGTVAQKAAGYSTGNLADSVIADAEKNHFSPVYRSHKDILQSDKNCHSTEILFEDQLLMCVRYYIKSVPSGAYAVVSYKDYNGSRKEVKITKLFAEGAYMVASFDGLQIADYSTSVTFKLYDSNGKLISTVVDSAESIAARSEDPLHEAFLAFCDAVYSYIYR